MSGTEEHVTVYQDVKGEWRWNRKGANNKIVSTSGEGYQNKSEAVEMAKRLNPDVPVSTLGTP